MYNIQSDHVRVYIYRTVNLFTREVYVSSEIICDYIFQNHIIEVHRWTLNTNIARSRVKNDIYVPQITRKIL